MVSIFLLLLNKPSFLHLLLLSQIYSLHEVKIRNENCWHIYLQNPVCDILKTWFSKAIVRYEPKHPPQRSRSHMNARYACAGNDLNII